MKKKEKEEEIILTHTKHQSAKNVMRKYENNWNTNKEAEFCSSTIDIMKSVTKPFSQ